MRVKISRFDYETEQVERDSRILGRCRHGMRDNLTGRVSDFECRSITGYYLLTVDKQGNSGDLCLGHRLQEDEDMLWVSSLVLYG